MIPFFNDAFLRWATRENRALWLGVALPTVLLVSIIRFVWPTELAVRWTGFALTFSGAVAIFWTVRGGLKEFRQATLPQMFRAHMSRGWSAFLGRRDVIVAAGTAKITMTGSNARLIVGTTSTSIGKRLKILEQQMEQLRDELGREASEREKKDAELSRAVQAERDERNASMEKARKQIAALGAGDWELDIVGAFWIIFGQICTTFPVEVASHLPMWMLSWRF